MAAVQSNGQPHLGGTAASDEPRAGAPVAHRDSPVPSANVVKDSKSETVAVLTPSKLRNTTQGLGKVGEEEISHLAAKPVVLGGAEGVVGEARGAQPEWIAKVKKVRTAAEEAQMSEAAKRRDEETVKGPKGEKGAPAITLASNSNSPPDSSAASSLAKPGSSSLAPSSTDATSTSTLDGGDDEGGDDKHGPKWLRKVKDAASAVKDKATGANRDSATEPVVVDEISAADTTATPTEGLSRTQTRASVSFAPGERTSADRIVTDRDGKPVPLVPGQTVAADATSNALGGGGVAASTSTSVKDKVLETHDVEPSMSDEEFRALFKDMPEDEELIETYRCALSRDVLVQGKLYVSETFLSFRANILGWETTLQVPWSEIVSIEKRFTAKIIPNAIEVRTLHATHVFASFIARDASYDLIGTVWRHVHPEADAVAAAATSKSMMHVPADTPVQSSSASTASAPAGATPRPKWVVAHDPNGAPRADDKSEISYEDEHGQKKRHRFRSGLKSLGLRRHRRSSASSGSSSVDGPTEAEKIKAEAQAAADAPPGVHAATHYDGEEYKNEALDCVLPTTPLKAFKLFFVDKAFLTKFMTEKEGLKEVEIGPWKALDGTEAQQDALAAAKERDITYLKPLNAPVGPKQTHCLIHDINEHFDEEGYFSVQTTTKTPDVPSGNDFATVTRSVFTWAAGGGCHVRVTTEVEWTKVNRFLRGVIERGAVDGQKTYHADLEELVRERIAASPDEYAVPGVSGDANTEVKSADMASKEPRRNAGKSSRAREADSSLLDSLTDFTSPVFILLVLVVLLFITNLFTLRAMRHQARLARQVQLGQPDEIASVVSRVLENFTSLHSRSAVKTPARGTAAPVTDLVELQHVVRTLERTLGGALSEVQVAVERAREVVDRAASIRRVH
ncbi:hypothetical protein JCM10908_005878 [Rhodotorula pacifica]|uniref:GRAM and VASt domain-containing protein n=1 Tax=Rhodotorula pacifica TaxID=1495444 RepID=UPI0031760964